MSRVVLDTSAYSWFRRGHPEVLEHLRSADMVLVPAAVVAELLAGFRCGSRYEDNAQRLSSFLREPFVSFVPADEDVAVDYADLYGELRRAGRPIPTNDLWIAATARLTRACVVTFDQHYANLPGVRVDLLTAA